METLKEIKVLKPENRPVSYIGQKEKYHDFADVSDIFSKSHINDQ